MYAGERLTALQKLVTQNARGALLHGMGSSLVRFHLVAGRLGAPLASGTWNRCSKETEMRKGRGVCLMALETKE